MPTKINFDKKFTYIGDDIAFKGFNNTKLDGKTQGSMLIVTAGVVSKVYSYDEVKAGEFWKDWEVTDVE